MKRIKLDLRNTAPAGSHVSKNWIIIINLNWMNTWTFWTRSEEKGKLDILSRTFLSRLLMREYFYGFASNGKKFLMKRFSFAFFHLLLLSDSTLIESTFTVARNHISGWTPSSHVSFNEFSKKTFRDSCWLWHVVIPAESWETLLLKVSSKCLIDVGLFHSITCKFMQNSVSFECKRNKKKVVDAKCVEQHVFDSKTFS